MASDDIFSTLGGSLMRDILGDISLTTSDDILSSLEAELDANMPPIQDMSIAPKLRNIGDTPLLIDTYPSAPMPSTAAMVVSHQEQRFVEMHNAFGANNIPPTEFRNDTGNASFYFDQSAAADFLREDAARKKEKEEKTTQGLQHLTLDAQNENQNINMNEDKYNATASYNQTGQSMSTGPNRNAPPPGLNLPQVVATSNYLPENGKNVMSFVTGYAAINLNSLHHPTSKGADDHLRQQNIQAPLMVHRHSEMKHTPVINQASLIKNNIETNEISMKVPSATNSQIGLPNGFHIQASPHSIAIAPKSNIGMQHVNSQISSRYSQQELDHQTKPRSDQLEGSFPSPQMISQPSRVYFCDPHPQALPIPASSVSSSLMPPRDLSYVIHSMMKPLHLLRSEPDEDYYYQKFYSKGPSLVKARIKKRDRLIAGREAEAQFRDKVESRAREWKGEKQVLGHIVKSNIHRPRTMLDFTFKEDTETKSDDGNTNNGNRKEEEICSASVRAMIWNARALIDKMYASWLDQKYDIVRELVLCGLETNIEIERKQYTDKQPSNLTLLLMLPKGRNFLARCLEKDHMNSIGSDEKERVISCTQFFDLLPQILRYLLSYPVGSRSGEDRLMNICTAVVVHEAHTGFSEINESRYMFKQITFCIQTVLELSSANVDDNTKISLRRILMSKGRAEIMHALTNKGTEMCAAFEKNASSGILTLVEHWKAFESEFFNRLTQ